MSVLSSDVNRFGAYLYRDSLSSVRMVYYRECLRWHHNYREVVQAEKKILYYSCLN